MTFAQSRVISNNRKSDNNHDVTSPDSSNIIKSTVNFRMFVLILRDSTDAKLCIGDQRIIVNLDGKSLAFENGLGLHLRLGVFSTRY